MRPAPGTVLHFSEDPHITRFLPHTAATAQDATPYVWAVDAARAPDYWFPRQCPRAMAWVEETTTEADRMSVLGPGASRVHLIEYSWLRTMQTVELFAYTFDAADFRPATDLPSSPAMVSPHAVLALGPPQRVPDLLALHEEAGIQLRLVPSLWPWWQTVITTTVGFSGIRLRNATPPGPLSVPPARTGIGS